MSKATRQFKARHNAKTCVKNAQHILGLPVPRDVTIAVADAPASIMLLHVDTEQEWALPKNVISDMGIIHVRKLMKIMQDSRLAGEKLGAAVETIASLFQGAGDLLQGLAQDAANTCLLITYVDNGVNQAIALHLGPNNSALGSRIAKKFQKDYGDRLHPPGPISPRGLEMAQEYATELEAIYFGSGVAGQILCGVVCAGEETGAADRDSSASDSQEPEPVARFCHACGKQMRPDARFCPACGTQQHG